MPVQRDRFHTFGPRVQRRTALQALGAGGAGLALAACSSSNNNNNNNGGARPAATSNATPATSAATRVATTPGAAATAGGVSSPAAKVRTGGTLHLANSQDPPSLDPQANITANTRTPTLFAYSRLLMFKTGPGLGATFDTVPDVATSFESADPLTYTFKLRDNATFQAPVNRKLDADDVVFSYQRFMGKVAGYPGAPDASGLGFVDSVTSTDKQTVVFKLKQPNGWFPQLVANADYGQLLPREAGSAFDPAKQVVGSGPWILSDFTAGRALTFKKNPTWHLGPDRPYMDGVTINTVPDAGTQLNQFLGGNLDTLGLLGDDVVRARDQIKGMQLQVDQPGAIYYVYLSGIEPNAPWRDQRVRQAISLALDRGAIEDGAFNLSDLKSKGVGVTSTWCNAVPARYSQYWLDPKSQNVAQYFNQDLKKAKDLLTAAGFPDGFSAPFRYSPVRYGQAYATSVQLIQQMVAKIGIKLDLVEEDYNSVFIVKTFLGDFTGWAYQAHGMGDPLQPWNLIFHTGAPRNHGKISDPNLDAMIDKINAVQDNTQRIQLEMDAQAYVDQMQYYIFTVSGFAYTGWQPSVNAVNDFKTYYYGAGTEVYPNLWKSS